MQQKLLAESIQQAENAKTEFDDYPRFDIPVDERVEQTTRFLDDHVYAPQYVYDKLERLYDLPEGSKVPVVDKKRTAQAAVFALEAARGAGIVPDAELEMFADFHEVRLKRMALVHNAWLLGHAGSSSTIEIAKQSFMRLNEELYGTLDESLARGMVSSEIARATAFEPQNEVAATIRGELLSYFEGKELTESEPELISQEILQRLQSYVTEKYADILAVVPDTDDTRYYNAEESRDIMEQALEAGGLGVKGWKVEISETKNIVSTNQANHTISLPLNTRRTANELRKLIVHEQEAHARRAQNGEETGILILKNGTANYADAEEGLGLILECALDGEVSGTAITRARDRYITAGLALGVDGPARDARQTFSVLWRMLAVRNAANGVIDDKSIVTAKKQAYVHIENAFRGTNYAMPGVIFTKLKVYYEGLKKNADYFTENIDKLDEVFPVIMRGKYNHTDPKESERINELLAP